jgi:predicted permease
MNVIGQVSVLFILLFLGFCGAKFRATVPGTAKTLSTFVLNITLPCLIIIAFQRDYSPELLKEIGATLVGGALIIGLSFLFGLAYPYILGINGKERGVHRYALISPNSGFIGYPMVTAVLGSGWLVHAIAYNIPLYLFAFSVGIWIVAKEGTGNPRLSWKNFANPSIAATLAGLLFFCFSVRLPSPLYQALKLTGDATPALSMIMIGISLADSKITSAFTNWRIWVTSLLRLVVLPLIAALVSYALGVRGPLLTLLVVLTAMPAGATTFITASVYDVAPEEAGALVFLSTLLCIASVPLIVFVLGLVPQ